MNKETECTTHYHACACRERNFASKVLDMGITIADLAAENDKLRVRCAKLEDRLKAMKKKCNE